MACCSGCGFLCYRDNEDRLREVNAEVRLLDKLPGQSIMASERTWRLSTKPLCFAMRQELREQIMMQNGAQPEQIFASAILMKHNCPEWIEWQQGFSPKEHREMRAAEDIRKATEEQRQREEKREQEQRQRDREWEAKVEADTRTWQAEQARKQQTHEWRTTAAQIVSTLLVGWLAYIATTNQNSQQTPINPPVAPLPPVPKDDR